MIVHNISDRPSTSPDPRAICVGNTLIRPGMSADIGESDITPKVRKLHGTYLWIGRRLPAELANNSRAGLRAHAAPVVPMTEEEVRAALVRMSKEELIEMCGQVSPPLKFDKAPGVAMLSVLLARHLFRPDVVIDPEAFYWTRRWARSSGEYEEK